MYYNLKAFGDSLKKIRHELNLTQKDVSTKVFINLETLRKIENGLVVPKQETLDLLSSALNVDIAELFLTYRMDNYDELETLKKELEYHLDSCDCALLEEDLIKLKELLKHNMNDFFRNQIMQLAALLEGILVGLKSQNYILQIEHFIQAISYTLQDFSLENYHTYYYNELELRLLINIAISKYKLGNVKSASDLLSFCSLLSIENAYMPSSLLSKLHYNLSYAFHLIDLHEKSLLHANLGIQYTISNRSLAFLAQLYYRKGIAQFYLGHTQYLETLQYSKNLFLISNHEELCNELIKSCKTLYGISV